MFLQCCEVMACQKGCEKQIVTAPVPLQVLPKAQVTEEFLAFLIISKLEDRQPLYHLEKQLAERHGIDCSRQNMARWVNQLMIFLQPLYNLLWDGIIEYDVAACDPTNLQVLNEPGRAAETKSFIYCMRGGPPEKSVITYAYNALENKAFVAEKFAGFSGFLHVDGSCIFENIKDIYLINCLSHARRKFEPIAKGTTGKGLAKEAMHFFKKIYKIERQAKDKFLNSDQRYALRLKESKPLLDQFKNWMDQVYPTVLPQSQLGKAFNYTLKRWAGLTRFLEDGRLEVDNNLTEQAIKPIVMARKNFLFAGSVAGANALCLHFSLIRTAKLHGLEPYHYYTAILKALPFCKVAEDYEKLLPWNIQLDYVKAV